MIIKKFISDITFLFFENEYNGPQLGQRPPLAGFLLRIFTLNIVLTEF